MRKRNLISRFKKFLGRKTCDIGLWFLRITRQSAIDANDFDEWQEMKRKLTTYRMEFDNDAI